MAAPVTMKSTLDNVGVLDPLLKFTFKNWGVTQFIILLIIKKITSNYYLFLQLSSFLFIICLAILFFLYFLFILMFLNFHSFLPSCSPHISHLCHFSTEIWSLIREMYFRRKNFYQKSGKIFFFWNTFMIEDWKISFTFRSCIHTRIKCWEVTVERKT